MYIEDALDDGGGVQPSNINTNDSLQFSLQIIVNHQSLVFSIRFLSDMAHQSALEDRYGILQLGEPSLGAFSY